MSMHAKSTPKAKAVAIIGAASCVGARDRRCDFGPQHVQRDLQKKLSALNIAAHSHRIIRGDPALSDSYDQVASLCRTLAHEVGDAIAHAQRFAVIGGDHSCAIGTWSGAACARRAHGPIGLIWIDAHMDSHTPETSHSGAIHGMPLASLLGCGDSRLLNIADNETKLQSHFVCLIGVRSYEPEEHALLAKFGVRVFTMRDVRQHGLTAIFEQALTIVHAAPGGYGISIDLDAIDPVDAPGVGSPEPSGIPAQHLLNALALARRDPALLGMEVAELNPFRDRDGKTAHLTVDLLSSVL